MPMQTIGLISVCVRTIFDTGFGPLPSTRIMLLVGFSLLASPNILVEPWVNPLAPLPSRNDGDKGCMLRLIMSSFVSRSASLHDDASVPPLKHCEASISTARIPGCMDVRVMLVRCWCEGLGTTANAPWSSLGRCLDPNGDRSGYVCRASLVSAGAARLFCLCCGNNLRTETAQ